MLSRVREKAKIIVNRRINHSFRWEEGKRLIIQQRGEHKRKYKKKKMTTKEKRVKVGYFHLARLN